MINWKFSVEDVACPVDDIKRQRNFHFRSFVQRGWTESKFRRSRGRIDGISKEEQRFRVSMGQPGERRKIADPQEAQGIDADLACGRDRRVSSSESSLRMCQEYG